MRTDHPEDKTFTLKAPEGKTFNLKEAVHLTTHARLILAAAMWLARLNSAVVTVTVQQLTQLARLNIVAAMWLARMNIAAAIVSKTTQPAQRAAVTDAYYPLLMEEHLKRSDVPSHEPFQCERSCQTAPVHTANHGTRLPAILEHVEGHHSGHHGEHESENEAASRGALSKFPARPLTYR